MDERRARGWGRPPVAGRLRARASRRSMRAVQDPWPGSRAGARDRRPRRHRQASGPPRGPWLRSVARRWSTGAWCWSRPGESSKPTTATSAGTRRPAAARTFSAPAAIRSDAAKTASMSGRAARSRFIATAPLSWVKSPIARRLRVRGEVAVGESVAVAAEAIDPGCHVLRSGDGGDDPPATADQMRDGGLGSLPIVDVDVARLDRLRWPTDHHDRHAGRRRGAPAAGRSHGG